MKNLSFSTRIQATPAKVWKTLWDDATYRRWTSAFAEGSCAETDWKEGSKVLFHDGKGNGMISKIARLIPNEFMSFEHLGMIKDGVEDFATAQSKGWAGVHENYTLRQVDTGTELVVEIESGEDEGGYFQEAFPKALAILKELAEQHKITPFLWFDKEAEAAVNLYTSIFPNSKTLSVARNGEAVMTASFSLNGQEFIALNGGPEFKINPSISFYTVFESETELDAAWEKLLEGGHALMPLDKYPWTEKYGWLQDRFGVSWQLSLGKIADLGQKITPALMFIGANTGKAEEAIHFYSSVFKNSSTKLISRYEAGGADAAGTINHAQFKLDGQGFIAMDSALDHKFQFNEAVSFVVSCDTQPEIDFFWDKLREDGGSESQCGWLKDRYGVSWQVVPPVLGQMLGGGGDAARSQRVMQAMMKMKKLDIATLKAAFDGV